MQYAIVNGEKRAPFKGGKGFCQLCSAAVVAHHGDIEPHHWQHASGAVCDVWHEPKTEWHISWQNKFPVAWQEFLMQDEVTGEKHFADVRTDKGLVVEFQNSPITPAVIREREAFYDNMVWVINASAFKDNFVIASKVSSEIKKLDADIQMKRCEIENDVNVEIRELARKVNDIEGNLRSDKIKKKGLYDRIQNYIVARKDADNLAGEISRWIIHKDFSSGIHLIYLFSHIDQTYGNTMKTIVSAIRDKTTALKKVEKDLGFLSCLEDASVEGKKVKKVHFEMISIDNYEKAFAIDHGSRESFFPAYQKIRNQSELFRYKHTSDNFVFYLDLSDDICRLQQTIVNLKTDIQHYEDDLDRAKITISSEITKWFSGEIASLQRDLDAVTIQVDLSSKEYDREKSRLDDLKFSKSERIDSAIEAFGMAHHDTRYKKMQSNKGLYLYKWQYEHKAWREAARTCFFHTGGSHLFERISFGVFRKVSIVEFISDLSSHISESTN